MTTGPCSWPLEGTDGDCDAYHSLDGDMQEVLRESATEFLWRWTGEKFGVCEVTIRPCRGFDRPSTYYGGAGPRGGYAGSTNLPWAPVLVDGEWFNLTCGGCGDAACGCQVTDEVILPGRVVEVVDVTIDGTSLPASGTADEPGWRVDNNRRLVRLDGGLWPTFHDLDAEAGGDDTWTVTYRVGQEVPAGGRLAAGRLVCEMARGYVGRDCALPQRIQEITRQGVSVAIVDGMEDLFQRGSTGLWLVDSWVSSVTAATRRRGGRVYNPDDMPKVRQRTGP